MTKILKVQHDLIFHIYYFTFRFALIHLCVNTNAKDRLAGQFKDHVFSGNYFEICSAKTKLFANTSVVFWNVPFHAQIKFLWILMIWQKYLLKITTFVSICTENKTNLMDGQGAKKEELKIHRFRGKRILTKKLCVSPLFLCGQNLCYYFLRKFIKKYACILFVLLQNSIIQLDLVCAIFLMGNSFCDKALLNSFCRK